MVLATGILAWKQKVPFKYPAEVTFRMLLGGFLLGGGNYMALVTTHLLGVAQGYPLTQLAIILNTLWGMLVFKEVTSRKSKLLIVIGIVTALIGAIVLNWARL
jgi:glucose uptake protein GlcU